MPEKLGRFSISGGSIDATVEAGNREASHFSDRAIEYGRSRQIAAAEFHARAEALRARDERGCYHL
jgi:hypothetical protein